ncbi:hypothetical protein M885DRAFT_562949 [Pelagophyceae sp. CCMP2097]|nr:hypothetical protein M885DRAFT_562949 [Pelagophyceae sp. CCMP2097]
MSVSLCQDNVFTLTIRQLLTHPDLELDLTYGVKKIGMKYDRFLFGMKTSDANCLAKGFVVAENLTTLVLQSNLIDDDLLRMLMTGLIKSAQITHLDFSHNKITNHGVRLLAKLLGPDSVLTNLSLADNQIHAEGGRYLDRAIRENDSLNHLNLRLNHLVDEGGRILLEGIRNNSTITNLNLSGNSLGSESAASLAELLRNEATPLQSFDVSCNQFVNRDVEDIADALASNKMICSLDLRMNATKNNACVLEIIGAIIHRNVLDSQKAMDS